MLMKQNNKEKKFEVLLEAIQTDFKVFGESLELVHQKMDGFNEQLDRMEKKLLSIDAKLDQKVDKSTFEMLKKKVELSRH